MARLPKAWESQGHANLDSTPGVASKPTPFVMKKSTPAKPVEDDPRSEVGLVFNEDLLLGYNSKGTQGTKKGPPMGPPAAGV